MPRLKDRFVVNAKGRKTGVILRMAEYREMLSALEELESIRAYDAAKASGDEAVPLEEAVNEIERERR